MVVNSISFLLFFTVVFLVYYFFASKNAKIQNGWLLLSSFFFYGWAEWRMLPLLIISILIFYSLGLAIGYYNDHNEKKSSLLTTLGVVLGVGILLYFKYLNFFIESFGTFLNSVGLQTNLHSFSIIMPLGISFFTFKLISYVIEVHRQHISPCRDLIVFGSYISFFPTILSGPIDRPKQFLSQLEIKRKFDYRMATDGCRQILWGMLKKMVVADNLAAMIDPVWSDYTNQSGLVLIIAALAYSIQMYMDFSGYSDMAIGVGKLLGIKVSINFNYPFFSRNIAEYWRNWHISLTSWLTDYVFMPLNIAFRNLEKAGSCLAIIITFLLIGLWHGANWTFAVFGLYHGILYIPLMYSGAFFKKKKLKVNKFNLPSMKDALSMLLTFCLVTLGLIIFRAADVTQAIEYIQHIFSSHIPFISLASLRIKNIAIIAAIAIFVCEWYAFLNKKEYGFPLLNKGVFSHTSMRILYYALIFIFIQMFAADSNQFIYFQF